MNKTLMTKQKVFSVTLSQVDKSQGIKQLLPSKLMYPIFDCSLSKPFSYRVFLATLVALHFTPVSKWVSKWAEFRTSVASRLASLFLETLCMFHSKQLIPKTNCSLLLWNIFLITWIWAKLVMAQNYSCWCLNQSAEQSFLFWLGEKKISVISFALIERTFLTERQFSI